MIDTSVLLAILPDEPEAEYFESALEADPTRMMSAASVLETAIVVEARLGEAGGRELDLLLYKAQIKVVAFTPEQLEVARQAYRTYGKGRHPAGLNYGGLLCLCPVENIRGDLAVQRQRLCANGCHTVDFPPKQERFLK